MVITTVRVIWRDLIKVSEGDARGWYQNSQAYIRVNMEVLDICGQGVLILQSLSQRDTPDHIQMGKSERWGRVEFYHLYIFEKLILWKMGHASAGSTCTSTTTNASVTDMIRRNFRKII